jgi:putative nucleotidyltransferase with HDIG domain
MNTKHTIKILINQVIPGMVAATDIYTKDNRLIVVRDTVLTDKIITRLKFYSIVDLSVHYVPKQTDLIMEAEDPTYYEAIRNSESFRRFHLAYMNAINVYQNMLDSIVANQLELHTDQLLEEIMNILYHCNTSIELFNMLHCMRNFDDNTYVHSLNVAIICNIIGKWLHFTSKNLEVITLCGLLHDLGKLLVPSDIILKPAKLTEDEFSTIKTHTTHGYNLVKNMQIDPRIKNSILMHHERCDGSGYPYGLYSDQIDDFAKLVSIADVYDAMTCARVYRGPLCPFEVISLFETEGYSKYDPKYIMTFLQGIVQTYIHTGVRLSNGMDGQIIMINRLDLSRPVIKVKERFIDLSKQRDVYITNVI